MKAYAGLLLLALCAFFIAPAQAENKPILISYSGTATDSPDVVGAFIISEAAAKGSFGATHVRVVSKFSVSSSIPACDSSEVPLAMDYARSVTTFADGSQLFVFWDDGWICGTAGLAGQASYRGWVTGHIVGGTGRFEGATGDDVETDFGGIDLIGPFVFEGPFFPGFGSWAGTLRGTVVFPD